MMIDETQVLLPEANYVDNMKMVLLLNSPPAQKNEGLPYITVMITS